MDYKVEKTPHFQSQTQNYSLQTNDILTMRMLVLDELLRNTYTHTHSFDNWTVYTNAVYMHAQQGLTKKCDEFGIYTYIIDTCIVYICIHKTHIYDSNNNAWRSVSYAYRISCSKVSSSSKLPAVS